MRRRFYTDKYGEDRCLVYKGPGYVCRFYVKDPQWYTSSRWQDEQGSILQIPDDAWIRWGIEYTDEEIILDESEKNNSLAISLS